MLGNSPNIGTSLNKLVASLIDFSPTSLATFLVSSVASVAILSANVSSSFNSLKVDFFLGLKKSLTAVVLSGLMKKI
jgi:hypothetical protein